LANEKIAGQNQSNCMKEKFDGIMSAIEKGGFELDTPIEELKQSLRDLLFKTESLKCDEEKKLDSIFID